MKIAIISDIHGHLVSLRKCLNAIRNLNIKHIICLGDILNGRQDTNDQIMRLFKKYKIYSVLGNHDAAHFDDADMIPWRDMLITKQAFRFFNRFPARLRYKRIVFTHICPSFDKNKIFYEDAPETAFSLEYLKNSDIQICFVGHTHHSLIIDEYGKKIIPVAGKKNKINQAIKYMINPGAVDVTEPESLQRVSYGIFDLDDWSYTGMDA
ncbi:metallophosphoesterase family protein [Desulfococcaceae bacterium HSG7]|nr:metallophosphoesterase family protein [Desulfococcaceae bacterium HSG7]